MKERVTVAINARITPADSERLEAIRKALGVNTSQAIRMMIRGTDAVVDADDSGRDAECLSYEEWCETWGHECNCILPGQSCPACRGEARKPFGDSIPYEF